MKPVARLQCRLGAESASARLWFLAAVPWLPELNYPFWILTIAFLLHFTGVMFSCFLSFNKYIFLKVSAFSILFMQFQPVTSVFNVSQRTNEKLHSVFK